MRPKKAVLCVDSDEFRMSLRAFVLQHHGFEVLRAFSGEQALAICADPSQPVIYAVVLELRLRDMSSFELARQLKPSLPDVPIVLCTRGPIAEGEFDWTHIGAFLGNDARTIDLVERLKLLTQRKRGPKKKPAASAGVIPALAAKGVA